MKALLPFLLIGALAGMASARSDTVIEEEASRAEDLRLLQEKIGQMETDLRAIKKENETIRSEIGQAKADADAARKTSDHLQKDIERLDGLIRKLDDAREQDRKVIIEEVSREINRLTSKAPLRESRHDSKETSPRAQEGVEHVVEKGQTLTAIAEAYGVSKKAIMKANSLTNSELRVGQKLFIPQEGKSAPKKR